MGWFSELVSSVASRVTDYYVEGAKAIGRAVSAGVNMAKKTAVKALSFFATKAEVLVEKVKETWERVKPHVAIVRNMIQAGAAMAPYPWLKAALIAIDKAIGTLMALENSPILKEAEKAVNWCIALAKRIQIVIESGLGRDDSVFSEAELEEARRHQAVMREVELNLKDTAESHKFSLMAALNDFEIVKADVAKVLESAPSDFEHYLRLRATQKLLRMAQIKFDNAKEISDLTADDIFLVRVASDLIKSDPELSGDAAQKLDEILHKNYNKKIMPFVYEEMVASWAHASVEKEKAWDELNRKSVDVVFREKELLGAKKVSGKLSDAEERELEQLQASIPVRAAEMELLMSKKSSLDCYIGAAEGFLMLLEKDEQEILNSEYDYLVEDAESLSRILMYCAENDVVFSELSEEDQSLIIDYSNIFREASKNRMKELLEVAA